MDRENQGELKRQLQSWQELREKIESPDIDPQTILDTLEGETNLHEALLAIAKEVMEREAANSGIVGMIADLQARKNRNETAAETLRTIILQAMDAAGIPTIKGDFCTLSKRNVKGKLMIEDETQIPARFFVTPSPEIDKKALKEALENTEDVPGACLSNGGISLTMRIK